MSISRATVVLFVAAVASVALVQLDPWRATGPETAWVSTRSAARKLLPQASGFEETIRAVTLASVGESRVRIVVEGEAHQVWVDDELLGPADPEAVEGLLASLRMATTLRAVAKDAGLDAARRGSIFVESSTTTVEIRVGGDTPDGAGVYGMLPREGDQVWVIEQEVALLLEQDARAWLLGRLSSIVAADVEALRWADRALTRGEDGIWRATGAAGRALLSNDAVDARIDRLMGATFEPLSAGHAVAEKGLRPWLRLQTSSGEASVAVDGKCPGRAEARVVDRGSGRLGCVSADLLRPWPVERDVEPRLLPHGYERVLAIAQERPQPRTLRREGAGWIVEEEGAEVAVEEPEVYRYYAALHEARVATASETVEGWQAVQEILVQTDSTQTLRLACDAEARLCRRDDGPLLRPVGPGTLEVGFSASTFERRRLVELAPGEARAVEILPADGGMRQSARLDLGTWRSDAPEGAKVDLERLEALLSAVMSARARGWTEADGGSLLRTVRIERTPRRGRGTVVVELHEGCAARVEGHERAALLFPEACAALSADVVVDAP